MRIKRVTKLWTNPRTKTKGYVVKFAIANEGCVDLVSSYCKRIQSNPTAVQAVADGLTGELVRLLCEGYHVSIPGVGEVYLCLNAEQFEYTDAGKCQVDSINGVRLKLIKSDIFKKEFDKSLKTAMVI